MNPFWQGVMSVLTFGTYPPVRKPSRVGIKSPPCFVHKVAGRRKTDFLGETYRECLVCGEKVYPRQAWPWTKGG